MSVVFAVCVFIVFREIERLSLLEAGAKSAKKGMWDKETPHVRFEFLFAV